MSTTTLEKLRGERETLVTELEALMAADDFNPADQTYVEARSRAEGLDTKIAAIVEFNQRRAAANEIDAISVRAKKVEDLSKATRESPDSIGDAWVRSKAYEDYRYAPRGTSGRVTLPFDAVLQTRAPILTSTFAGLIRPDRIDPSGQPAQQTPLLDLISRVRVNANSVEWIYYPSGAPLGTVTAEGSAKTEAAVTPSLKTVSLDTIASWAQYSRQFGEDAPGLVDFLNANLSRGILDKREALAAAALTGDASIPVTANTTGTLLQGIRRAIASVQTAGYKPNAVALNPQDYAGIDIELLGKIVMGVGSGPQQGMQYWGVVPIPVGAVPSGTAFVGDFTTAMVELVRSEVQVYTTDSHASTFTSNVLTTLVECRTKPIVHRAEALTKVSGTVSVAAAGAGK
jgi:HK97 family phage major capsid protein